MNFGSFIRNRRAALGLDQKTCADRSGIDGSTFSRVENDRTRPILLTAIQICQGMGVSLADLMDAWLGNHPLLQEPVLALPGGVLLTTDDVEAFIEGFRVNALACSTLLADTLNRLVSEGEKQLPLFVPMDVLKLLIEIPIYRFEITYPTETSPETLISVCRSGGMLTFCDIGHYVNRIRRGKSKTLAHQALATGITPSVLSRIETGTLEQIKLADILTLDKYLEQGGMLLMLYWRAGSAQVDIQRHLAQKHEPAWTIYEEKLAVILVTVYRWVFLKNPKHGQWVNALRQLDLRQEHAGSDTFLSTLIGMAPGSYGKSASGTQSSTPSSQERE